MGGKSAIKVKSAYKLNQLLWSKFKCRFCNIKFCVSVQNNRLLTYEDNYSQRQMILFNLISYMKYERQMSWRRISAWLNSAGIRTHRGKTWSVTGSSVHSVIKRMSQRKERIEQIRNRQFPTEISDFIIEKY